MFELSIALKYLIPRKKSLSTALISALSVLVISLVVWLVLVFLSVTSGIEKNWLKKLTSLHAPIRITPTEDYYKSYYYQIDSLSLASNYTLKTIGEKRAAVQTDPYCPETDMEIPVGWPQPVEVDPVKTAFESLATLPGCHFQDYEISGALLKLHLQNTRTCLSQMAFLLSIEEENPQLASLLSEDSQHLFEEGQLRLPDLGNKTPVLMSKHYREGGAKIGDLGTLHFHASQGAFSSEQSLPIQVVGFYDPGILSSASKCLLVPSHITRLIQASTQTFSPDGTPTNGIFVWIEDVFQAKEVAQSIEEKFRQANVGAYWKVVTYEDFEFSKDLMLQFKSDKTLFLLIACILLIVACCNIISLLVLLVHDKKKEIAILQSMGTSFSRIALIFGLCGIVVGLVSSLVGLCLAIFTLHHMEGLVSLLSAFQGHAAFNPAFFGQSLPDQLSLEAVRFVLILTPLLALTAGLVPAFKACRIRPSHALRAE